MWDCIKTRVIWNAPNHVIVFFTRVVFSGGGLSVLDIWIFQLSAGVKASLVESQQMSSFVFISSPVPFMLHSCPFMLQSCPFMFRSCSCHVPVIFAFISFHVRSLCIKHTGLRKVICSNRSGRYPSKCSRCFLTLLSFLLSFCYRFGGLCRLPSSGFMNMYMYKLFFVWFLLLSFSGPVMHW